MGPIQEEVNKWLEELPRQLAAEMLSEKLRACDIRLSEKRLNQLIERLLAGETGIKIDAGKHQDELVIDFTAGDLANLNKRASELMDKLPAIIDDASDGFSDTVLAALKKRWRGERSLQLRDMAGFRKRLDERWGKGLAGLRMLITIAREFVDGINKDGRAAGGGTNPQTFDVLSRLHARACQVAEEVTCLLEHGLADGAMARWRTLHEICAMGYLLEHHGDSLTQRYIDHQIVESRGAALQYREYQERLGQEPIAEADLDQIESRYQAALVKHGPDFREQYGWAAGFVGRTRRPTLADIQKASNIDHLSPYYKMASHGVHANPKGVFFKLGLVGNSEVLLAGPSNAGLCDPGHATALSLTQISSVLMKQSPTIDNIVAVKIMERLADEIGDALLAAHQKLVEDERAIASSRSSGLDKGGH